MKEENIKFSFDLQIWIRIDICVGLLTCRNASKAEETGTIPAVKVAKRNPSNPTEHWNDRF